MPIRTLKKGDLQIEYTLTIKKVKNINMRISQDGTVEVSASKYVPFKVIDEFVMTRFEKIFDTKAKFENKPKPLEHQYINGEIFRFFGEDFVLNVAVGKNHVYMNENIIFLTVSDIEDIALKQRVFNVYIDQMCEYFFNRLSDEIYKNFKQYNLQKPTIKMRKMKSRWGSCHISKKVITLNKMLIKYPISAIESVITHEYCHFLEPNHSRKFYKLMETFMPDFKQREACLKENY